MLDSLSATAKALLVSVLASIAVGLLVYSMAAANIGVQRGRITELTDEIGRLKAAQSLLEQRLSDADAQQKALAARLTTVESATAPPPPAASPVEPAPQPPVDKPAN
jgi:Tfp pilus assembly protein PilN